MRCSIKAKNVATLTQMAVEFDLKILRRRCFHFVLETSMQPRFLEQFDDQMIKDIDDLFIICKSQILFVSNN